MSSKWREVEHWKADLRVKEISSGFRVLIYFYLVFFSLCFALFLLSLVFPWINQLFTASRSTPWGIFTSLFIHNDLDHLLRNMVGFFSFLIIFLLTNYFLTLKEKTIRLSFLIVILFISAILSNLIWVLIVNIGTIGASGLVYAFEGAVTGFCLVNFWDIFCELRKNKANGMKGIMLVNLSVFILIFIWMIFYTNSFLNYKSDSNVLIHGSSFMLAFIFAIELGNIKKVLGIRNK